MAEHLFVYGTLMPAVTDAYGGEARQRLRVETQVIGTGRVCGMLYDLGAYPGLVQAGGGGEVAGLVLRLTDAAATLAWLDVYEGIDAASAEPDEYARVRTTVTLDAGGTCPAWVYVYLLPVDGSPIIADGRWRPPVRY
ncbi:MAG: hypothetical protein RLZ98_2181 [Pseudomonadota bacterium]